MSVCETIGTPSKLRVILKTSSLVRMLSTLDLRCEENTEVEVDTVGLWMMNS